MCVTHHTNKYASTCSSSQKIAFALQIHWLTFCITFGSQRTETREKCVIRILKPEDLGFWFKCCTKRFFPYQSITSRSQAWDRPSQWLTTKGTKQRVAVCVICGSLWLLKAKCRGCWLGNMTEAALVEVLVLTVLTLLIMKSRSSH